MRILHAFSHIYFIFQGSLENHSKTLKNLKNIFPAAAFEKQSSGIKPGYTFYFAINFNKKKIDNLLIGIPRQNTCRFCQLVLIIKIFKAF